MDGHTLIRKAIALEEWISQFFLAVIVLLVFVAAFTRYIGMPINWSVDIAQALFVWVIFLGRTKRGEAPDTLVSICLW